MRGTDPLRTPAAWLVACTLLLGLLGCADDTRDDATHDRAPGGAAAGGGAAGTSIAQRRAQEQRILDARARAVRDGDVDQFLRRVDHGNAGLMARQRRYFENLVQLPLARLSWRVSGQEWGGIDPLRRWGRSVHVPRLRLTTQLEGYDAVPVERTVGLVFSFRNGRATIVSDRTDTGSRLFEGTPAPWDLSAVDIRSAPGVLGVFDRSTRSSAPAVLAAVRDGIGELDRALPFTWPGRVVVYSVASPRVLASFTDVPGGKLDNLGALTFPTYARTGRPQVASTRVLLMPSSVRAGRAFLERIARHELSHVAIGTRDDGAPTWLSEGVAEYLGSRDVPEAERMVPTAALQRARGAAGVALPRSSTFNGPEQEWNYALSWMACDHVVATLGESRLWALVEAMHDGGTGTGTGDTRQDRVLRQVLGYDGSALARHARARMRDIFG